MSFAGDTEGILTQVHIDFRADLAAKKFDWLDLMSKQLAIFINVSVEAPAATKLYALGALDDVEALLMACKASDAL